MFNKKNNNLSRYLLIFANILPLYGVFFLDWKIFEIIFVYFSETIIFTSLNILKIFYLKLSISSKILKTLKFFFSIIIFIVFAGAIIFLFYIGEIEKSNPNLGLSDIMKQIFSSSYFSNLATFAAVYLYSFFFEYLKKKEYDSHTVMMIIKPSYLRVWLLLIISLASAYLFSQKIDSVYVLVIFIVIKTGIDFLISNKKIMRYE